MRTSRAEASGPTWLRTGWGAGVVTAVASVLVAVILAVVLGPRPMHLGIQSTGDTRLAGLVRDIVDDTGSHLSSDGYRGVAVALLNDGRTRYAGIGDKGDGRGPTASTPFELGSVTKLFTGLMLADAVDRGEVRLGDTLSTYLTVLAHTPAGSVTLEELATHRSGLPAYASDAAYLSYEGIDDADVSGISQDDVLTQTAGLTLSGRGTYQYSNLGVSLLGFALAKAAGAASWVALVTDRVLKPAGMTHTVFAATTAQVPQRAATGRHTDGVVAPYSVGPSYFPAGTATFTTTTDLAAFATWVMDGKAIGLWALTPRYLVSDNESIGLVWMSSVTSSGTYAWHIGAVPGFTSSLRIDVADRRAVAVLGNTDSAVDEVAIRLLERDTRSVLDTPWVAELLAVVTLVGIVGIVAVAGLLRPRVPGMVLGLVSQSSFVLLLRFDPWQQLPQWAWAVAAAVLGWATVLSARRTRWTVRAAALAVVIGAAAALALYWAAGRAAS